MNKTMKKSSPKEKTSNNYICPAFDGDCKYVTNPESCFDGGLNVCKNGVVINLPPIVGYCPYCGKCG